MNGSPAFLLRPLQWIYRRKSRVAMTECSQRSEQPLTTEPKTKKPRPEPTTDPPFRYAAWNNPGPQSPRGDKLGSTGLLLNSRVPR